MDLSLGCLFFFFKDGYIRFTIIFKILLVFIFILPSVFFSFLRLFTVSVFPSIHFLEFGSPSLTQ